MDGTVTTCPLCQHQFERQATPCAQGCPLSRFCQSIRCPQCQFEFPDESRVRAWFKRWFHRRHHTVDPCEVTSLCDAAEGESHEVACVVSHHESRRNTLAVYGLVPGSTITLQQKRPGYVIRVGETELALETSIAREIFVKRHPDLALSDRK